MAVTLVLDAQDRSILLHTAREAILASLEGRDAVYEEPTQALTGEYGLFVTLHIGAALRGCIGTFYPSGPLFEEVREIALSSAFQDRRFPALTVDEFPSVAIEISVLTPLELIDTPEKVEVGKHGVYVRKGGRSGVLLPQVAIEQGWDREQFLKATCRKAGLSEDSWRNDDIDLYTFSAVIFS